MPSGINLNPDPLPKNQPITLPDESFELERNQQKDGGVDKAPGNKYSKQSFEPCDITIGEYSRNEELPIREWI